MPRPRLRPSPCSLFSLALLFAPRVAPANNWPPPGGANLADRQNWPNDPDYANQWNYWSFIGDPARRTVRPEEMALGSGIHADEAWQLTTGDRRILIAVLDSGIRWNSPDLVNKFYLNRGELPPPDAACGAVAGRTDPYDANGDGIFNVQDYTTARGHDLPVTPCDPRVHDTNGNGFIDPQDLIAAFSNHIDDDHNGYIDDISGWDMLEDDNDPNDDTDFGHGTGEAKYAAAEGNNGRESLGVCPDCTIMMVRVGDSFVVDTDDFAMGVLYAVDRGTAVIQEALGSYDNSSFAQAAIDYAYQENVLVVGSAADEDSFHQNYPGGNEHTIYVHAIRADAEDWQYARTYLNFNNCTNYGGQLALSTPGNGCSSEATGRTGGIAGLLASMALLADVPAPGAPESDPAHLRRLSAEELKQLLIGTVDDIYVPGYDPTTQYFSQPGWEQRFGYGRPNAGRAVRQIAAGKIPPEVNVERPYWFEVIDPGRQPMVPIQARIGIRKDRFQSYDWTLEWAAGIEPPDSGAAWHTIDSKSGVTDPVAGPAPLAMWDVSALTIDNPPMPAPDYEVNRHLVTLRLRVTAHSTTVGDVGGVMRKTVHVFRDPSILPGYPVRLGASGESSPKLADLDGNTKTRELVIADSDGRVHVLDATGHELPGWPFTVSTLHHIPPHKDAIAFARGVVDHGTAAPIVAPVAVGDLDGDGRNEVVVATRGGEIWALHGDGRPAAGFPVQIDPGMRPTPDPRHIVDVGFFAAPVVADLDGDGKPEIIAAAFDGQLYAWHGDGRGVDGFPVLLHDPAAEATSTDDTDVFGQRLIATPAVGDIDGDKKPDIVVPSTEHYNGYARFYAVHGDGNRHPGGPFLAGWPVRSVVTVKILPVVGSGVPNAPALADVDGDGVLDVVVVSVVGVPKVFQGDGTLIATMQNATFGADADTHDSPMVVLVANPSLGDLDGDGRVDVVAPAAGFRAANAFASNGTRADFDHEVGAWTAKTGDFLKAFPRRIDDWQFFANPIIADVDGDGRPEVVAGSAGYFLRAWDARGRAPAGWPKFTGGWIVTAAAVGDMDGDGKLEVVASTRNGWLYAWHTAGRTDGKILWESFHHDLGNTGSLATRLTQGGNAGADDSGCNMAVGMGGKANAGPFAVILVLLIAGARRRCRIAARI
jgi:hypothetical protein